MNRICIHWSGDGLVGVTSDEKVRCFVIDEPNRTRSAYELSPKKGLLQFGRDKVDAALRGLDIGNWDYLAPGEGDQSGG